MLKKADAAELEAKTAKAEKEQIKKDQEAIAADLEKVRAELKQINEVRAAEKAQNDFNARMGELNEKFALAPAQSKSIASDIKGLDDESYSKWLTKMEAFLVAKKCEAEEDDAAKEAKAKKSAPFEKKGDDKSDKEDDKDMDDAAGKKAKAAKEAKASLLEDIKNLQPETQAVINKMSGESNTLEEMVASAFKGLVEVEK